MHTARVMVALDSELTLVQLVKLLGQDTSKQLQLLTGKEEVIGNVNDGQGQMRSGNTVNVTT